MLTDTGALSDKEKKEKRKYRGELPQYLKRFKAALDKIQNPKDAAARKVKTLREFIESEIEDRKTDRQRGSARHQVDQGDNRGTGCTSSHPITNQRPRFGGAFFARIFLKPVPNVALRHISWALRSQFLT